MAAAPLRTALADTYPAPSNATLRTGLGALWDFLTGLLGITGTKEDALTALRILSPDAIHNLSLVPSVATSALTMNVKTRAGAAPSATDPVMVGQRNATLGSGDFNLRTITAALSLVISSGSTLGHTSAVEGAIYWYLLDNAGAQELAASTAWFGEFGIASTTAEGGAGGADSATAMYSATARTSVPFRFIGSTLDTQTAAGTWAALPSAINLERATGTMSTQDVADLVASETVTGMLELATNAEALAGSDTTRAVTSAGLASSKSMGTPGYMKFPGGLIAQWGTGTIALNASGDATLTYPLTFPATWYTTILTNGDVVALASGTLAPNSTGGLASQNFSVRPNPGAITIRINWVVLGN